MNMSKRRSHNLVESDDFGEVQPGGASAPSVERGGSPIVIDQRANRVFPLHQQGQFMPGEDEGEVIRRVWGVGILGDEGKLAAIRNTRSVLREEIGRMLVSGINIGQSLNDLCDKLSKDEFDRGFRECKDAFPGWSASSLSKFMHCARFLQDRKLDPNACPQSISVLYDFTTLDERQFEKANTLGLFNRNAKRSDIQGFKRLIKEECRGGSTDLSLTVIEEARRLDDRIRSLTVELRDLRERRALLQAPVREEVPASPSRAGRLRRLVHARTATKSAET